MFPARRFNANKFYGAEARAATLGAAARISGVTPAALVALLKHVKRRAA
jgi:tRNA U34 5-carboxymethylaminomethyl modifying enzyme MnmG/GidA